MIKNKLKEIRMRELLIDSQLEFADKLQMNVQQYNRYEKGIITPTLESAFLITDKINKILKESGTEKYYKLDDIFYLVNE